MLSIARSFQDKKTSEHRVEAENEVLSTSASIQKYDAHLQDYEMRLQELEHVQAEKDLVVAKLEANLMILRLRSEIGECNDEISMIKATMASMTGKETFAHTYQECEDNKQVFPISQLHVSFQVCSLIFIKCVSYWLDSDIIARKSRE